ncbi:hypothetical protein LTR53_014658 [Teratosphaeriaceae sp. CCFEE 6253]|nr:hypothetical protein LTR53_014658 [Teratosphaeriaceae sp. CCFEE 6253]
MRSNILLAAAIARLAAAAPTPQQFDFAAVLEAPSPSATGPPLAVAADPTSTYSVDTAEIAASVSAMVTTVATASITGASASEASTQEPSATAVVKRGSDETTAKTTSTKKSSSTSTSSAKTSTVSSSAITTSSSIPATTPSTSTTNQQSSTSTTSSDTACPTTPEAGTYCGFINPEDPCAPQPDGYGPQVKPDTVAAFQAYPEFHKNAQNAVTPSGYARTFKDLNASTSANSYIAYKDLTSYSTSDCASFCDSTNLCTAFNVYIERDPGLNPTNDGDTTNSTGSYCPNPTSITNYKCSLWGSSIDATSATNGGGYREDFQVVIVGSNGYDKTNSTTPPALPDYEPPTNCTGAISAGGSYWLGSSFFPGPFNPSLCAIYAKAQTATNKQAALKKGASSYTPANMLNAFMTKKNGVAQGTYCSLYNTVLDKSWAGFKGGWSGANFIGVESSWTYSLKNLDSGNL